MFNRIKRYMARTDAQSSEPMQAEQTGRQTSIDTSQILGFQHGRGLEVWREMRKNPTIALARMVATAPLRKMKFGINSKKGIDQARQDLIKDAIEDIRVPLIRNMLYGVEYGHKPFEIVWSMKEGWFVFKKIKPLAVDKTNPIIDKATGQFMGIEQEGVMLDPLYSFWYTHEQEDDDYNGTSRYQNVEQVFMTWEEVMKKMLQYLGKVSPIVPLIQFPVGRSKDRSGRTVENYKLAEALMRKLEDGAGIIMPNGFVEYARQLLDKGVSPEYLKAWSIEFLQGGAGHGGEYIEIMRHLESLMARGMYVPERAISEGQYGTKAEAGIHADLMFYMMEDLASEIARYINWYLVDKLLLVNYGPGQEGTVWVEPEAIVDEEKEIIKGINAEIFKDKTMYERWLDVDMMLEKGGLPKTKETVDLEKEEDGEDVGDLDSLTAAMDEMNKLRDAA